MSWKKRGLVFNPVEQSDWMFSHASNPIAEHQAGDIFKIYFSCRNKKQNASVGYVVVDVTRPGDILEIAAEPVVDRGQPGYFDDSGVSAGCFVHLEDGQRYFYYLGWNLCVTVPFHNSIGLAISAKPGAPFVKHTRAAIMDRDPEDPLSISYPWVLKAGPRWQMWYGSHECWQNGKHEMLHVLKYAESDDGIHWKRLGKVAFPLDAETEYAVSRPCVLKNGSGYKMWYSFRGSKYRIGYAESDDGLSWQRRDDQVGIDVSDSGWDSEAVSYASVFAHNGQLFMLYNGNGYGRTGFGLASLD